MYFKHIILWVILLKNAINYYYNIYIQNLIKKENDFYFYLNNEEYHLIIFNRPYEDINSLYKLNIEMIKRNILVHKIILNKNNEVITLINDRPYILIKLCNYKNDKIFINDIKYYQNYTNGITYDNNLLRDDWINMWCEKIDYYEYQISEFGKKYPLLLDSISYYIGLGENAISFFKNNSSKYKKNNLNVVSHKRVNISDGSFEFYNPINFIIDTRIRDISEYIKNSFFCNELNLHEIKLYLNNTNFSEYEYVLFYSRLLFPTYYFDIYDEIINNNLPEEKIINIIEKNSQYEEFLYNMYIYITKEKNIFIEPLEWILRRYI